MHFRLQRNGGSELMDARALAVAKDPESTVEDLRQISNRSLEINRLIASHPNSDSDLLQEICDIFGDDDCRDSEVIKAVIQNPRVSIYRLGYHGRDFPELVINNPALNDFFIQYPDLYKVIPELLFTPGCPVNIMRAAAKDRDDQFKALLLLNPELPADIAAMVSPEIIFNSANTRLQGFIDGVKDDTKRGYLNIYKNTTRPFCVPRYLEFDRDDLNHRFADQVLCGFPYTSVKWPWPMGNNELEMQPIAQIDLSGASKLLGEDFGTGLFQIWGSVGKGERGHLQRIIPPDDLVDELDEWYPSYAPWLDVEPDGSPEFNDCLTCCFDLSDYRPFGINRCRVEWVSLGRMFYPSIYLRLIDPLLVDFSTDAYNWPRSLETDAEKWDAELEALKLPTGLSPIPNGAAQLFLLGGYGDGQGNTWRTTKGNFFLYHSIDYAVKISISVQVKRGSDDGLASRFQLDERSSVTAYGGLIFNVYNGVYK